MGKFKGTVNQKDICTIMSFQTCIIFLLLSCILNNISPVRGIIKRKGSSDVKGSLWNHLDKKVLL